MQLSMESTNKAEKTQGKQKIRVCTYISHSQTYHCQLLGLERRHSFWSIFFFVAPMVALSPSKG